MSKLKKIGLVFLVLLGIVGVFAFSKYQSIFAPNVPTTLAQNHLYIPTGTDYEGLKHLLSAQKFILDEGSFDDVAGLMKYKKNTIRSGRYEIQASWSNRELIQHLRSGKQSTVQLILNNERLLEELAGKVSSFIEPDSLSILDALNSQEVLDKYNLVPETVMTLFIPNTYEVYWNTTPKQFIEKMAKESEKFWSKDNRTAKSEALNMTRTEVYTLASIVEKETNYKPEKPTIAGVYLNRLDRGILLQADPTVVFANQDFTLRRVLNKHLEIDSPYNTYKYAGLPPGPISMSSISSIDAVLNKEEHKYLYFCAKPDNTGQHAFARNLSAHNANARKFQKWLNKQRIYR